MPYRASFAVAAVVSFAGVACSAPPPELEGDPGAGSEAITVSARSGACNRSKVMASVSGARKRALERGFAWLDKNVPYSQARTFEGYRTDCSGFVSMCWETGTSFTTAIYSSGGGNASTLRSWNELLPGDALVRNGHMMLFTGWADAAKTGICALEQASTASDMQFRVRSVSSLRGESYKPIRSRRLGSVSAPTPSEEEEADSTSMPSGTEDEPVGDPPETEPPATEPPEREPAKPEPETSPEPEEPEEPAAEPAQTPTPEAEAPDDEPEETASSSSSSGSTTTKKKKGATSSSSESDGDDAFVPESSACAVAATGPSPGRSPAGAAFAGLGLALALTARRRRGARG